MQYSIPILAQMPRNRLSILFTLQFLADDQNRTNLKNVSFFFFKKRENWVCPTFKFQAFFYGQYEVFGKNKKEQY